MQQYPRPVHSIPPHTATLLDLSCYLPELGAVDSETTPPF